MTADLKLTGGRNIAMKVIVGVSAFTQHSLPSVLPHGTSRAPMTAIPKIRLATPRNMEALVPSSNGLYPIAAS
jgi:hypothetical protein